MSVKRFIVSLVITLVVGIGLGVLTAWFTVFHGPWGSVRNGPWGTSLEYGNTASSPAQRARVALRGLFALNRNETLYYTTSTDSQGQPLDGACRYELSGKSLQARWWSITAYGADDFLIPNPDNRYSVSGTTVSKTPQGDFTVQVGATGSGNDWIPVAPGQFSLTLRLYNPDPAFIGDPGHAALPLIQKVSCS